LLAQLERYSDMPGDVEALHELLHPTDPTWIDSQGKVAWYRDEPVLTFGKHRERPLKELVEKEPDYLRWVLSSDFPEDTKLVITEAMEGKYPVPE
jgi:DNA polymerase-3 subunit epsilon